MPSKNPFSYLLGFLWLATLAAGIAMPTILMAHGVPNRNLRGVSVPRVIGLTGGASPIIVSQKYARILGKSLFWDMNAGSNGTACATCHYHAGADERSVNQLNPGDLGQDAAVNQAFHSTRSGTTPQAGYALRKADFPFWTFEDPSSNSSKLLFSSDDVVGSAGTFKADFVSVGQPGVDHDECNAVPDSLFHSTASGLNTRAVTNRNAPTVINAAFNVRNFWDGRANNIFNGESPWGIRDLNAGVWISKGGKLIRQRLMLKDASLASQAVGPPVNSTEMACNGRRFPQLGASLLDRRALESQAVAADDGVLGPERHPSGHGLRLTYRELVRKAFAPRYWKAQGMVETNGQPYPQMEANFALFFGLALQMYESTLVSDQTPYDTPMMRWSGVSIAGGKVPHGLSEPQRRGLAVFLNAHCQTCHAGPTFSAAANPDIYLARNPDGPVLVDRNQISGGSHYALRDVGFANTGVVPTPFDPGQGARDPWGNPLSYTRQYLDALLAGNTTLIDPVNVYSCDMEYPFMSDWTSTALINDASGFRPAKCSGVRETALVPSVTALRPELDKAGKGKAFAAVEGVFKIPSLRNVELTGPYMHNGSMATLEQVVEFYNRGANVANPEIFKTMVFPQALSAADQADLVEFLKSLTDERVRWERAPFDHPALKLPEGSGTGVSTLNPGFAEDLYEELPAVGKHGRSLTQGPLRAFAEGLPD